VGAGIFRRPFWASKPSQDPLGAFSVTTGPVNATLAIAESDDVLDAAAALDVTATAATTEVNDGASSAGTLDLAGAGLFAEADDAVAGMATLDVTATVATAEADDGPSAAGVVQVTAALAITETDDALSSDAAIAIIAAGVMLESDDDVSASALMPIFYPRRGGFDDREDYERWLKQWHEQLRRIIDRSFKIANGEIDPITFEPIPPPDYSPVIGAMISQALSIDQARTEAFMAEQRQLQEDDAIALLLLT
jgi:hypothetical protein